MTSYKQTGQYTLSSLFYILDLSFSVKKNDEFTEITKNRLSQFLKEFYFNFVESN